MLVKSTPGVNFINILQATIVRADPKSAKNTFKSSVFFVLSGSTRVKTACKTMMKLTPGFKSLSNAARTNIAVGGRDYYIQANWNLAAKACRMS